jgi:RNA polymerase sigma factor (sigma-70 family)
MTSLNNLWQEYGPALKYFICRRVSDEGLVEEIFQDVVVKVQSRLDDLRDPTRLRSWIYQICRYTIIDHYRHQKITAESPDNLVLDMIAKATLPDWLRSDPNFHCGCISGAAEVGAIETMLTAAGFNSIQFRVKDPAMPGMETSWEKVHQFVSSAAIEAVKPDAPHK